MDRLIRTLTGLHVQTKCALHGGDLSQVTAVTLDDGTRIIAKSGPRVATEARMLAAMARAGAPVPQVLGQSGDLLLIEALDEAPATPDGWATLGHGLRKLHDCEGDAFGWDEEYAFGPVPILNGPEADWTTYWTNRRLRPFLPDLPPALATRLGALAARLPDLLPAQPPRALLHGDLWVGNALFGPHGRAHMIDPACYHGDGEVDLAMLHLFATPPPEFHAAYGPLASGWEPRRAVYQLWPALVHLVLFGAGYRGMVEARLAALGV